MHTVELAQGPVQYLDIGDGPTLLFVHAFTQLLAVHHPGRVGRLVLTNCDAFENFLPPVLRPFQLAFRTPGFGSLFAASLRARAVQRLLYALLAHTPLEPRVGDSYFGGFIRDPQVRRDARKVALGIRNRYTLEAARHFSAFHKPVLIAWGQDDWVFPPRFGERLARAFPDAHLKRVRGSKTFVAEDRPEVLGSLISAFVPEPVLV